MPQAKKASTPSKVSLNDAKKKKNKAKTPKKVKKPMRKGGGKPIERSYSKYLIPPIVRKNQTPKIEDKFYLYDDAGKMYEEVKRTITYYIGVEDKQKYRRVIKETRNGPINTFQPISP